MMLIYVIWQRNLTLVACELHLNPEAPAKADPEASDADPRHESWLRSRDAPHALGDGGWRHWIVRAGAVDGHPQLLQPLVRYGAEYPPQRRNAPALSSGASFHMAAR